MKINVVWDDLPDISAYKEALVHKSKAIVTLLPDQAPDSVWQLYTVLNIGT